MKLVFRDLDVEVNLIYNPDENLYAYYVMNLHINYTFESGKGDIDRDIVDSIFQPYNARLTNWWPTEKEALEKGIEALRPLLDELRSRLG